MSNDRESPLEGLPLLWNWYRSQKKRTLSHDDPVSNILLAFVESLVTPGIHRHRIWFQGIETFLNFSTNPLQDFLALDTLTQDLGKPVSEIISMLCEGAICEGQGAKAFDATRRLADHIPLAVLRFLCAWVAMNNGNLQDCIDECEKESDPQAPIYTLMGQAFLELGHTGEAIDSLKIALKLDQNDILAGCQLAKAYLVVGNAIDASAAITHCRNLVGNHIEIECLAAMAATTGKSVPNDFSLLTLERLSHYIQNHPESMDVLFLALDLACAINSPHAAEQLILGADFRKVCAISDFQKKLAQILKKLGDHEWYQVSKTMIDQVMSATGQGNPTQV